MAGTRFTDPPENVYHGVHRALHWGMVVSTVLYATGVVRAFQHPAPISLTRPEKLSFGAAMSGLVHLDPASLMLAATLVLIATPVARVAIAFAVFWKDRDFKFVQVTGLVLVIILLTVVLGRLGLH